MENLQLFKTKLSSHVLTITIENPEQTNTLDLAALKELRELIQEVYDNSDIKGVVITGSGKEIFAAGPSLSEVAKLNELNARKFAEQGQEIFTLIENCHKPIIAAVNGKAVSAGCELALCCHLRVATSNARFGLPEVAWGIVPCFGGTQRLPQLVGKGRALEMMMTGKSVPAADAHTIGLANYVVSHHEMLLKKCEELLKKIIGNAPLAVGMLVNCINAAYNGAENGYQTEANSFAHCCKTEDFKEGAQAILEKRPPTFQGK